MKPDTQDRPGYGGFAACYIASTLEPQQVKKKDQSIIYESKPRTKRKYKK